MRYDIVINRESGSGIFKSGQKRTELEEVFTGSGHTVDIHFVPPEDLEKTLRGLATSDADALLVGGGDGTVNTAASLLLGTKKVLGVIPLGTFNLEARDLKMDLDPLEAARQLIHSKPVDIDVLTVNGNSCLCACVIGFYPALAKTREEFHGRSWWKKSFRVIREIATVAVKSPALDLEIVSVTEKTKYRTRLAAFAPGRFIESIGIIPDRESLSSGELTAYISEHLTRGQMLGAAWSFLTGTLFGTDGMKQVAGQEITINVRRKKSLTAMIDGEIMDIAMPCTLKIHPRALQVLRPKKPST